MRISEAQRAVDAWIGQFREGYWPPLSNLARLIEEVGELARELNHRYGHKPKKPDEPEQDLALELADIMFVIIAIANEQKIDLEDAFRRTLDKYRVRDFDRFERGPGIAKASMFCVSDSGPSPAPADERRLARGAAHAFHPGNDHRVIACINAFGDGAREGRERAADERHIAKVEYFPADRRGIGKHAGNAPLRFGEDADAEAPAFREDRKNRCVAAEADKDERRVQ